MLWVTFGSAVGGNPTASAFITRLDELTTFALAHLDVADDARRGRGVLRPATIDSMLTPAPASQSRRGLGYVIQHLDGDLRVVGHAGGGGDFRVAPETGDGLVILTNADMGYLVIDRIRCVWESQLTEKEARCPAATSYALLGAYGRGGVTAALDYYEALADRGDPDYVVGLEPLSEFARLLLKAGREDETATVYRHIARSETSEGAVYGDAADQLEAGYRLPEERLSCYVGEYRSPEGDAIRIERTKTGATVTIDPVEGIGGPVRALSSRMFVFDVGGGYTGELVFDLTESGAATRVRVREMSFGITLTAERTDASAVCD